MDIEFKKENFSQIVNFLSNGEAVIMPSDTAYGISGDPNQVKALESIQKIKNRNTKTPFLLLVSSIQQAEKIVILDTFTKKLAKIIWPGPCTFVLPRKEGSLKNFFPTEKYIAIRVPNSPLLLNFLRYYWKKPLISTSANISGFAPENNLENLKETFKSNKKLIYCIKDKDENDQLKGLVSTIIKVENKEIEFLRDGIMSRNNILNIARRIFRTY